MGSLSQDPVLPSLANPWGYIVWQVHQAPVRCLVMILEAVGVNGVSAQKDLRQMIVPIMRGSEVAW